MLGIWLPWWCWSLRHIILFTNHWISLHIHRCMETIINIFVSVSLSLSHSPSHWTNRIEKHMPTAASSLGMWRLLLPPLPWHLWSRLLHVHTPQEECHQCYLSSSWSYVKVSSVSGEHLRSMDPTLREAIWVSSFESNFPIRSVTFLIRVSFIAWCAI